MVLGPVVLALAPVGLSLGLGARGGPLEPPGQRAPRAPPGQVLSLALQIQELSERGLQPVTSIDPFTGATVISTADQERHLFGILEDRAARELLAPTPGEIAEIRELRDIAIEAGRNVGTSDVRLQELVANVPEATRVTARLVAPGVVGRGNVPSFTSSADAMRRRLSGPCAGPQTGISRLRCAQGAFT